ncbi:bromodomain-containing protein 7 isoform X3 [Thamnophis elegans]|uniref:bromodomain-containing protein 7 isoform X3 n=1 Tax=Thamnophis elegans TaxID=35005 RepID=UPI001377F39C|nr:bromodomain-containing protein 7 isoform X3 [Thamnophis elegans]
MRAMGKKHKRHKGEKYPYEEYVEKPLKLVLKVGGNEVAELSTQSSVHDSSLYEDKSEYEKHKDKKRKKRKKMEKQVPGEEKEKRKRKVKEDKKKRDRDAGESEGERELKCQSPLRLEVPLVKSLASSLAKQEEVEQTPLQEALNQLVRQLQRKDPNAFFSFPVTDFIAPGYSMIIKRPMDFSTMKEKIKHNGYQSIEELKDNFRLMCTNAMVYNKPETIYYKAAKKLLHSGMKILSQERIQSLKQSIDFMADLQKSRKQADKSGLQSGGEEDDGVGKDGDPTDIDLRAFKSPIKDFKKKEKELLEEKIRNSNLEKEQELIECIIKDSGGKLTKRSANTQCEFERRKPDGTTTLGLLTPAENMAGEMGYNSLRLGATAGRLQSGVNTLQGFKEDKRNKVTPVMYLNYGPFSSYAPAYDSTFANISKDDSDLIYSTYGEDSNPGIFNIDEFLAKSHDHPGLMTDSLLDVLTQGEHSRTLRELETLQTTEETERLREKTDTTKDVEIIETDPAKVDSGLNKERLTALRAVTNFGVPAEEFNSEEAEVFQRKLDETTKLICDLQDAQNERLSTKPPPNMICLLGPSYKEMHLAEKVTNNLKELAQQVAPGDIVSTYGIRKAMGISLPAVEKTVSLGDFTEEIQDSPKAVILLENECEPVAV